MQRALDATQEQPTPRRAQGQALRSRARCRAHRAVLMSKGLVTFAFFCSVEGHLAAGMLGKLVVSP